MDWNAIEDDPERRRLAIALADLTPGLGWGRGTLALASRQAFSDADAWKRIFPRGARDAIWHISRISDASMVQALAAAPAASLCAVIGERLDQNAHMKSFVRRVMLFDMLHPFQALARMQRTARAMMACLPPQARQTSAFALMLLNLAYTGIVFVWLFDRTSGNARTRTVTKRAMGVIGFS